MKTFLSTKRVHALTLIEVLVVIAVLAVFAAMIPCATPNAKRKAQRIQCINNIRQMPFRVWEGDHNDKYSIQVSQTNGGTMEFITGPNVFRHFQIMSNELKATKFLICPADTRVPAVSFDLLSNSNISYFVNVDANETDPQMILLGDRNITNGTPIRNGLLELTTNHPAGWTAEMHVKAGNIAITDGSIQQASTLSLRQSIGVSDVATNRLQMP